MPQLQNVLIPVKDASKGTEVLMRLGLKPSVVWKKREALSQEQIDSIENIDFFDDECHQFTGANGAGIELLCFYETYKHDEGFAKGQTALNLCVEDLDETWESLKDVPGVRLMAPPTKIPDKFRIAVNTTYGYDVPPMRFALIRVDLDRVDGEEQTIVLEENYKE